MNKFKKAIISVVVLIQVLILPFGANPFGINKAKAAGEVSISIVPSAARVSPGNSFTVDIQVDPNGKNINQIQFDFEFDPSLVQADSITFSYPVDEFSIPGTIDNDAGIIIDNMAFPDFLLWDDDLGDFTFGLTPFTLATIKMTAKSPVSGTSYLRLPSDTIFYYDGSSYTDNTLEAQSSAGTPFTILADTDDFFYVGLEQEFDTINFSINGPFYGGTDYGEGVTLAAEYYSTNWSSLAITDGTSNLSVSDGSITFTVPGDWTPTAVNGVTKYWVRLKTTTNPTPIATPTGIPKARNIYTYLTGFFEPTVTVNESGTSDYLSYFGTNGSIIASDDATSPTITSVTTAHADGSFKEGEVIDIAVAYDEAVNVVTTGGTPTLALNSGGSALYNSGTGTDTLTFRYTVSAGENSADLDYSATNSLVLNGGTIKDAVDNDADNTLPAVGTFAAAYTIVIDTTAPVITENTPVPTPTADSTPDYTFTSSEAGAISYGGDCSSATTSAVVGANTITFDTLADGAHGNCTITVTDAAGNPSNLLAITAFTVDTTPPSPPSPPSPPPPPGGWLWFPSGPRDQYETSVYAVYQELLGRDPDSNGLNWYAGLLRNGTYTVEMIRQEIRGSWEYKVRQVDLIYRELLGRSGDADGLSWYAGLVVNGGWTFGRVIADIKNSPECKVKSAFREILARWPDADGLDWYFNLISRGWPETELRNELINSAEYRDSQVVIAFHQLLGRDPDSEGLQWYNSNLRNGWTVEQVWNDIRGSSEFANYTRNQITLAYQNFLGRNPDEGGLNYYFDLVKNSGWTVIRVRNDMMASPESWGRR